MYLSIATLTHFITALNIGPKVKRLNLLSQILESELGKA